MSALIVNFVSNYQLWRIGFVDIFTTGLLLLVALLSICLLYTSDAADDLTRVDLGVPVIVEQKKTN